MLRGNLSNARGVGRGVHEFRIHSGPGYRIYFGRYGDTLIILLGGARKTVSRETLKTLGRCGESTGTAGVGRDRI